MLKQKQLPIVRYLIYLLDDAKYQFYDTNKILDKGTIYNIGQGKFKVVQIGLSDHSPSARKVMVVTTGLGKSDSIEIKHPPRLRVLISTIAFLNSLTTGKVVYINSKMRKEVDRTLNLLTDAGS